MRPNNLLHFWYAYKQLGQISLILPFQFNTLWILLIWCERQSKSPSEGNFYTLSLCFHQSLLLHKYLYLCLSKVLCTFATSGNTLIKGDFSFVCHHLCGPAAHLHRQVSQRRRPQGTELRLNCRQCQICWARRRGGISGWVKRQRRNVKFEIVLQNETMFSFSPWDI